MSRKRRKSPLTGETQQISDEFRPKIKNHDLGGEDWGPPSHLLDREGLNFCCGDVLHLVRLCLASTFAARERSALRHLARRFWNQTLKTDIHAGLPNHRQNRIQSR